MRKKISGLNQPWSNVHQSRTMRFPSFGASYRAKNFKTTLILFFSSIILLVLLSPLMLYEFGLFHAEGRPAFAARRVISEQESQTLWQEIREAGADQIELSRCFSSFFHTHTRPRKRSSCDNAIWPIVTDYYNSLSLKEQHIHGRTLSKISLYIWLTRNWTTKDIMAKLKEIKQNDATKSPCARLIPSQENRRLCYLSHHSSRCGVSGEIGGENFNHCLTIQLDN